MLPFSRPQGAQLAALCILPRWRRKGYGSYLLKEVLRSLAAMTGKLPRFLPPRCRKTPPSLLSGANSALPPRRAAGAPPHPGPDGSKICAGLLAARLVHPQLCVDATCGNGGDTAFLCNLTAPAGRVLAFDVQPEAIRSTRTRLEQAGVPAERYELICGSHADLLQYVQPGTADAVMFNFGWLPGADHAVFSTAQSSIPALQAALQAVRPGGIVSAILYSGAVIGSDEKQAVLRFLRALPLKSFTVLVCDFANWAETAPLPCLILKK